MSNAVATPEREVAYIDKSGWGDGPWQSEPDKVQWTDGASGLRCLAVRNPHSGHWCGYVGVAEGHPLFGVEYGAAEDQGPPDEDGYRSFDVHGGLTYSDFCQEDEDAEDHGICHTPLPGQPEKVWWFGFDCAHSGDLSPAMLASASDHYRRAMERAIPRYAYRTLGYVQEQCRGLAEKLAALA